MPDLQSVGGPELGDASPLACPLLLLERHQLTAVLAAQLFVGLEHAATVSDCGVEPGVTSWTRQVTLLLQQLLLLRVAGPVLPACAEPSNANRSSAVLCVCLCMFGTSAGR